MLNRLKTWLGWNRPKSARLDAAQLVLPAKPPVPVFWLLGKTGSGKTSIVRYLTGASTAEIGNGYQPQTKTSLKYDFPSPDDPIVRFLDTRGLGESGYNPEADIAAFNAVTHVVVVVVRVMDHALEDVLGPLRHLRRLRPSLPVLLALTCLHEAYPREQHPDPDPFSPTDPSVVSDSRKVDLSRLQSHPDLARSLVEQQQRFEGLFDEIVPLDLTPPEEGFVTPNFGGQRLELALMNLLPAAYRQSILYLDELRNSLRDLSEKRATPVILSYSSLAAAAAAVPLPWIDIPAVMSLQTRLIYVLADQYDQQMNVGVLSKMVGAVAGQMALRFAVRAPLKLIPILGQTANSALAFAYTYSLGKACCWYFGECQHGHTPSSEELKVVWGEQLQQATERWKRHRGQTA